MSHSWSSHILFLWSRQTELVGGSKLRWTDSTDSNAELDTNSLWMFCLIWSSTFKLGLGIILVHRCCFMWNTETLPSWWVFLYFLLWNVISTVSQIEYSVNGLFSAMFETSDLGWITSLCSQVDYPQVGQGGQTSWIPCIKGMCDRCK